VSRKNVGCFTAEKVFWVLREKESNCKCVCVFIYICCIIETTGELQIIAEGMLKMLLKHMLL